MSSIYDWSTTEANNGNSDSGIDWLEGQLPSTVNNSARYMMRRGKELLNDLGFVAATAGTANTITLTASSPFTAYADGMFVTFRAALDNTGAATLNVNSIGAKNIYKQSLNGEPQLVGGEIQAGALYRLAYVAALNSAAGGWIITDTSKVTTQRGHLYGLTLSNNAGDATNDIDIAAGECASDAASPILMQLSSTLTKRLDAAWAVGSGNGGWLDGASMPNGTGHAFLMQRSDTGVIDAGFSASLNPTLPANYDRKRRIGSIIRQSAVILPFSQQGNEFLLLTPIRDVNVVNLGATAVLYPLSVPIGVKVNAKISGFTSNASAVTLVYISSPDQTDVAATATALNAFSPVSSVGSPFALDIRVDTSGQIRARAQGASTTLTVITSGWSDNRGRI